MSSILVTGSTGNIGKPLVATLLEQGHRVRAVLQPGVSAPWPSHPALESVTVDLGDRDSLAASAKGVESVFMLVPPGPEQERWQSNIVHAARGARRVVKISAFDTGPDSTWAMGRWHFTGEQELLRAGIPHVILRPQYFMQNLLHDEATLRAGLLRTYIPLEKRVGMIDAADIAAVAAALLVTNERTDDVLFLTGPSAITGGDAARAIGEAIGRPIDVEYLPPPSALRAMKDNGWPEWLAIDTVRICQDASPLVTDVVPSILGRPARSIAEATRARFTHTKPKGDGR